MPRFALLPQAILEAWPEFSPAARNVATGLAAYMDAEGRCWPSQGAIAARMGISGRSVRRGLSELKSRGLVAVRRRARRSAVYTWMDHERPTVAGHEDSRAANPGHDERPPVAGLNIGTLSEKISSAIDVPLLQQVPGADEARLAFNGSMEIRRDLWGIGIRSVGELLIPWAAVREEAGVDVRLDILMGLIIKFSRRPWTSDGQRILYPIRYAEQVLINDPRARPDEATRRLLADAHKRQGRRRGNEWGRTAEERMPSPRRMGDLLGA